MFAVSIARRGVFLMAALVALAACQSEKVVPRGTVILQHESTPAGVTELRALGFDAGSQVSFGPATVDMGASVTLPGVPVTTTTLELVYSVGEKMAGIVRVPVTVTTGTTTVSVPAFDALSSPVTALTISPSDVTLVAGLAQSFTATATFEDGTSRNLSSAVEWSVSDAMLAEVSVAGLVTTHAKGTVTLTAKFETVSSQVTITIAPAAVTSIELTPAHPALDTNQKIQLTATAHLSDGTTEDITATAEWTVSSGTVTAGLVTPTEVGALVVRATSGGQTGETTVNVFPTKLGALQIEQGPTQALSKGTEQTLTVTGILVDGTLENVTSLVTWSSSDPAVAVDGAGHLTAVTEGVSTITATLAGQVATLKVTVIRATVVAVHLTAHDTVLPAGTSTQLMATAVYTDGSEADVTAVAFWLTSALATADVVTGEVTATTAGTVTISASYENVSGSLDILVQDAALASIEVSPKPGVTLQKGRTQQLTATGTFTDGSQHDLSTYVTWTSSTTNATVDGRGVVTGAAAGDALVTAALKTFTASTTITVVAPTTVQLVASPSHTTLAKGTSVQLTAEAILTDGQHIDITDAIAWTSTAPSLATVTNHLVAGVAPGTTAMHGSYDGKSIDVDVVVTDAVLQSLTVTPASLVTLAKGEKLALIASGRFSDGTTQNLSSSVIWQSNHATTVGVSESGLAFALGEGSATVSATFLGFAPSVSFVVMPKTMQSLQISPASPVLADGAALPLKSFVVWSDGTTTDVTATTTWTTGSASIATISTEGVATGVKPGTTQINAAWSGLSATASTLVTEPELVGFTYDSSEVFLAKGESLQIDFIAVYSDGSRVNLSSLATWSSLSTFVATIDASGRVTAVGTGAAVVGGTFRGFSMSKSIRVTEPTVTALSVSPASKSLPLGDSVTFAVTATYSDGSTGLITTAVPYVDAASIIAYNAASATATGSALGTATVTFTSGTINTIATVYVTDPVLRSLTMSSTTLSLAKGKTSALTVTGTYSDGSQKNVTSLVTWSSSTATVATATSGVVTALATGSTTITATIGTLTTTCATTVTTATVASVALSPSAFSLPWTKTTQIVATATFTDGTTSTVTNQATWASTVSTVASVAGGLVAGVKAGTSTISATYNGQTGNTAVTVTGSVLDLLVTPRTNIPLEVSETQQLVASGSLTDGTTVDVSSGVSWSSGTTSVATVSATGLVTALTSGTSVITATAAGTTSSVTVRVRTLSSIQIVPTSVTLPTRVQYAAKAQANYSDGTKADITSKATWSMTDTAVATVSSSGVVLAGNSAGATSLNISYNTKTATAPLTVTSTTLQSLRIEPSNLLMAPGTTRTVRVMGTFGDGSQQDLTSQTSWSSDNTSVATASGSTVSALTGSSGASATLTISTSIAPTFASTTVTLSGGSYAWAFDNNTPGKFYQYSIDATGFLTALSPANVTAVGSISAIGKHPNGRYLYSTNASGTTASQFSVGANGQLTALTPLTTGKVLHTLTMDPFGRFAFMLDNAAGTIIPYTIGSDGLLTAQGTTVAVGTSPQRLIVHPNGKYLYAAVWTNGAVFQYAINTDGSLTALSPSSVSATTQIQGITLDATGSYAYVAATGEGAVYQYRVNPDGTLGALYQNKATVATTTRQIILHPTKKLAYVVANGVPTVFQMRINEDGGLEDLGKTFSIGTNEKSALVIDPAAQCAYLPAAGESKIYRVPLNSDGTLSSTGSGVYATTSFLQGMTRSQ